MRDRKHTIQDSMSNKVIRMICSTDNLPVEAKYMPPTADKAIPTRGRLSGRLESKNRELPSLMNIEHFVIRHPHLVLEGRK